MQAPCSHQHFGLNPEWAGECSSLDLLHLRDSSESSTLGREYINKPIRLTTRTNWVGRLTVMTVRILLFLSTNQTITHWKEERCVAHLVHLCECKTHSLAAWASPQHPRAHKYRRAVAKSAAHLHSCSLSHTPAGR